MTERLRIIELPWRVLQSSQIWQAAHDRVLCTVVRIPNEAAFFATIVSGGDIIAVLEDSSTLEDAQAWCVMRVGEWELGVE
jgi:hypothetical protein